MSTNPTVLKAPHHGTLFGELLVERYKRAGESQRDVAEWLTDWMTRHDLDEELATIERNCTDDDLDITKDAIAVIRNYLAAASKVPYEWEVSQGAVSKWCQGEGRPGGGKPSPAKWVAVAAYMGLGLGELHRLVTFMEMPKSMVDLQRKLESANKDIEVLRRERDEFRAELERAEARTRQTDGELAALRLRLDALDRTEDSAGVPVS